MILLIGLERNRNRWNTQRSALHGRADRAGNGNAQSHVFAIINSRYNQVWFLRHDFQHGVKHGLRGRSAYCINGPLLTVDFQFLFMDDAAGCAWQTPTCAGGLFLGAATVTYPSAASARAAAHNPGERMPSSLVNKI